MYLGIDFKALFLGVLVATQASAQVAPNPAGWPKFWYKGVVTNKTQLKYNPTNEFIFPSVFNAKEYLKNPLGNWYLYYAPHDNPGGISLMYADHLEGPWKEYANNPVIARKWSPHYDVPHVSSPDAKWNKETSRLFVYFHGSNSQTRWAETTDGVKFSYGGIAIDNKMGGPDVTETSYARVFTHRDTASGYKYGMFYMGNERDNIRRIRLAESQDGKKWVVDPNGKSYARTIDKTLRKVGTKPILLHKASGKGDDTGRVASPEIVNGHGSTYLFYESGDRLGATIAWAKMEKQT